MVLSLVAVFVAMHAHRRRAVEPGETPTASTTTRPDKSPNATTRKAPTQNGEYPRFTFRFSSRGGCFADSDYFFEAQSGPEGARWKAVLDGYGEWHEVLLEQPDQGKKRPFGNFVSQGTFTPEQAKSLIEGLVASGVFDVSAVQYHTGPTSALYLDFGGRTARVSAFQSRLSTPKGKLDANQRFLDYCYNSFVTQAGEGAQKRFDQGLPPDSQPPHPPGPTWPLDSASLFNNG